MKSLSPAVGVDFYTPSLSQTVGLSAAISSRIVLCLCIVSPKHISTKADTIEQSLMLNTVASSKGMDSLSNLWDPFLTRSLFERF
jgi:hypothetical protein